MPESAFARSTSGESTSDESTSDESTSDESTAGAASDKATGDETTGDERRDDDAADREALARIYERSRRIERCELDRALEKLESGGDLTDEQREAVTAMADAIVSSLASMPARTLRRAADEDDATRRAVRRLFGPDD